MKNTEFTSQMCTTREQSQRLLDMGLNPETADMTYHFTDSRVEAMQWELQAKPPALRGKFWTEERIAQLARGGESGEEVFDRIWGKDVPAWSFPRLLELMPKRIERIDEPDYILWINNNNQYWKISYMEDVDDNVCDCLHSTCGDDLIEACVFMVELLIKNNYQIPFTMKKKEFAVGEVFQFGLKKLKVKVTTPSLKCIYCYFAEACKDTDPTDVVGECEANKRSDRMEVIFAEVEDEE